MKPATIYDVAREAGVSHQTVTRYLRGYEGIRDTTRQRVEDALALLEYRPNTAARQLRLRTTNRVAVLADRIGQGGPALIVQGVTQQLQQRGFVSDIITIDGDDPASVDAAISLANEYQVAGILATAQTDVVLERLKSRAITVPIVIDAQIVEPVSGLLLGHVAGQQAAEHLLALGHRHIAYLAGPAGWLATRDRQQGFVSAVEAAGLALTWTTAGDWTASSGYTAWRNLKPSAKTVTAVGVANDAMAVGVMAAILDEGLAIPEQISIIGTDDMDEARFVRPALSTVRLDFEDEGRRLAEELLGAIASRVGERAMPSAGSEDLLGTPRLVHRQSTSTPPELPNQASHVRIPESG